MASLFSRSSSVSSSAIGHGKSLDLPADERARFKLPFALLEELPFWLFRLFIFFFIATSEYGTPSCEAIRSIQPQNVLGTHNFLV